MNLLASTICFSERNLQASAKTKVGIQQVFDELVSKIVDNPVLASGADANARPSGLVGGLGELSTNDAQSRSGMCC